MSTRRRPPKVPAAPAEPTLAPMAAPAEQRALAKAARKGRAALRQAHLAERRGDFDADAQRQAVAQRRQQLLRPAAAARGPATRAAPVAADPSLWLPIGPTVVLGGQAAGAPNVSGRVRDVHASPDGLRVYAATANGGVWFSEDAGATWRPLGGWTVTGAPPAIDRPAGVLACGCLWVRFGASAATDEVLVGTGEPLGLLPVSHPVQGTPGRGNEGVGVLRSVGPALSAETGAPWTLEATNLANKRIYRIVADPTQATPTSFVAATSDGLWFRTGGPTALWTEIAPARLGGSPAHPQITDAAWVRGFGATPPRLWVAVRDLTAAANTYGTSGLYVSNGDPTNLATTFAPVSLGVLGSAFALIPFSRVSLAAATSDPSVLYALSAGPRVWRIDDTTATPVQNIPANLLGTQAEYDQAIAVHPSRPQRIALGGAFTIVPAGGSNYNAAIFVANVTRPNPASNYSFDFVPATAGDSSSAPAYVGTGVHPDVHLLRFVPVGARVDLWTGCDGGVFRSLRGDDDNRLIRDSFLARNSGLCTLECGYVATHPRVDGHVIAGAQDNGTLERIGMTLWRARYLGDGGGLAYHPTAPERVAAQYVQAGYHRFEGSPGFGAPILRNSAPYGLGAADLSPQGVEDGASSFYSGMDAIADGAGGARVALGSFRPWFSPDWGTTWLTLPTLTDALPTGLGAVQLPQQDACVMQADGVTPDTSRGQVIACRWATPTRLLVLCQREVLRYELIADATKPSGFRAERHALSSVAPGKCDDPQAAVAVASPGLRLPEVGPWSDIASHDPAGAANQPHGSFYVATTGDPSNAAMDTLWWFDGHDRWHATGLRNDPNGIKAPAYAVCVDTADRNIVYVGTAVGVWKGTFSAGPHWTWQVLCNGLPEAAVQDLAIHQDTASGVRLLRAAIQARGVWEVDLAHPALGAHTLLRVHAWDTRRGGVSALVDPTQPAAAPALSWVASPDVRVRPRRGSRPPPFVGAPGPAPQTLRPDPHLQWVFQTALHATDPLVRPTGVRTAQFEARLRVANGNSTRITRGVWNAIVGTPNAPSANVFADPWNGPSPTEADLFELVFNRAAPAGSPCSQVMAPVRTRVDVLVHHRHSTPAPTADVRVTLLRRTLTAAEADGAALPCAWTGVVQNLLRNAGALPALTDTWTFADESAGGAVRSPAGPVDARQSRAVTFDVDLHTLAAGTRVMLLALVHSGADPVALPGGSPTLQNLVLGARHVAARLIEIA